MAWAPDPDGSWRAARPGAAVRAARAVRAGRVGAAAEAAWAAGSGHGQAGNPPAVTHEGAVLGFAPKVGEVFAWNGPGGRTLAASLGITSQLDASGEFTVPDYDFGEDDAAAAAGAACLAYSAAYEEQAAGCADLPGRPGAFLPGLPVTTALGRKGVLTGAADFGWYGYPRVLFEDGTEQTVPREALTGPVVHLFSTRAELSGQARPREPVGSRGNRGLSDGDVALVLWDGTPWVMRGSTSVPADELLGMRDQGRYEASTQLASRLAAVLGPGYAALPQLAPPSRNLAGHATEWDIYRAGHEWEQRKLDQARDLVSSLSARSLAAVARPAPAGLGFPGRVSPAAYRPRRFPAAPELGRAGDAGRAARLR